MPSIMAEKQLTQSLSKPEMSGNSKVTLPAVNTSSTTPPNRIPKNGGKTASAAAGSARQLHAGSDDMTMRSPLVDPGLARQTSQPFYDYPMPMGMWNPMLMGQRFMPSVPHMTWDEDDSGDDEESCLDGDQVDEVGETGCDDDIDKLDLLGAVHSVHDDEDGGPDVSNSVASVTNDIWDKGCNSKTMKTLFEKYPWPGNVSCYKVDLNDEVISAVPKWSRARDLRLRAVQGMIARESVPAVRIVDALYNKDKALPPQEHVNTAIDCCSMIAAANSSLNQLRRELLKTSMQRKYHSLCNKAPTGPTRLLFGDNLAERVKSANASSSLMTMGRGRGREMLGQWRFSPYGNNPGHYGGYQAAYQPTFPHPGFNPYSSRPRGRPFLGESPFNMSIADRERQIDCQNDNYAHIVQNQYQHVNTNVVSPVHRVEEPRREVAQEREGEQVEQDYSAVHTD